MNFPLGAMPLSSLAGLASGASPSDLIRMGQSNPGLVSAVARQVQRNPKAALNLAGSLIKKNAGKARGAAMRINRPPEMGRILKLASKSGLSPMLAKVAGGV